MFDVLIRAGTVIDGTGRPGFRADLGITGDRIAAVGDLRAATSQTLVDATDRVVTPGFIDAHAHSDLIFLTDPQHAPKLSQGVTTEVIAQDGMSYAPLSADNLAFYRQYLSGLNGNPPIASDWSSIEEYRRKFDRTIAINTVFLVPHGTIRLQVLGMRDVPLVDEDLRNARAMVEAGLASGAVGLSTGLSYFPGSYADTRELIELTRPVAAAGGVYVSHIRTVFRDVPFDPVDEAIEIGRDAGAKVHISHFRTDEWNAGHVDDLLKPVELALNDGADITLDVYPYPSGSGFGLGLLPPWVHEGSIDDIVGRLASSLGRERILGELTRSASMDSPVPGQAWGVERIYTHLPSKANSDLVGLSFREAARRRGIASPEALLCTLLAEERLEVGTLTSPPTDEVWRQMDVDLMDLYARPYYMVGSDSISVGSKPHPRLYGSFPRLLGRMRRRFGSITLETLVQRVTSLPAARFGLRDRGRIHEGLAADLVVFDPDSITDHATYDRPAQISTGIDAVFVNGRLALEAGQPTGILAGRPLP